MVFKMFVRVMNTLKQISKVLVPLKCCFQYKEYHLRILHLETLAMIFFIDQFCVASLQERQLFKGNACLTQGKLFVNICSQMACDDLILEQNF